MKFDDLSLEALKFYLALYERHVEELKQIIKGKK